MTDPSLLRIWNEGVGDDGLEISAYPSGKTAFSETGGAVSFDTLLQDPAFMSIAKARPQLSEDMREKIAFLVGFENNIQSRSSLPRSS
jgi:hypothetical protein